MIPYTWRDSKSLRSASALRAQWTAFLDRVLVTDAPAELDQIEAALDAETPEAIDTIIVALAGLVTFAWTAFLIALLFA